MIEEIRSFHQLLTQLTRGKTTARFAGEQGIGLARRNGLKVLRKQRGHLFLLSRYKSIQPRFETDAILEMFETPSRWKDAHGLYQSMA